MTPATTTSDEALLRPRARGRSLLRGYSDAVNVSLLDAWLPDRCDRVLKTDLFDEAVGQGLVPRLGATCRSVVGIDVSPAVVEAAGGRYRDLEALVADVRELPFEDGSFDAIVSNSTLDHFATLAEAARALQELSRVLARGGTLVVTMDNTRHPLVALRNVLPFSLLARLRLVEYRLGASCGPRGLRRLVERAGLSVEREATLMHVPRVAAAPLARVVPRTRLLAWLLACEHAGRLPSRTFTGQFVAVRAVKP